MAGEKKTTLGGCHCGAVRFRIEGPLAKVVVCHCSDCMKTVGNSMAVTGVLRRRMQIDGDALRWYRSSEKAERGFCGTCGATMFYRGVKGQSKGIGIAAGLLDDPSVLEFGGHIYLHARPGFQPLEADPVDLHEVYLSGGFNMQDDGDQ